MSGIQSIDPIVRDNPKCEELVVAYGRWPLTLTERSPNTFTFEGNQENVLLGECIACI